MNNFTFNWKTNDITFDNGYLILFLVEKSINHVNQKNQKKYVNQKNQKKYVNQKNDVNEKKNINLNYKLNNNKDIIKYIV